MITSINEFKQSINISTNSYEMWELLKKTDFIKYVDRPSGRFLHSIDLVIKDEINISDLNKLVDDNNWYIERSRNKSFTITQKYVEEARVEIPKILYHATPSKNIDKIMKYGLKSKSEDLRHKYPPRIYVSDNINSLKPLIKELKHWKGNEEYSIIKIDTNGLNFELYIDSTSAYKGHYYIQGINKIPNKNIEVLTTINK